jgi:hypothetical protein
MQLFHANLSLLALLEPPLFSQYLVTFFSLTPLPNHKKWYSSIAFLWNSSNPRRALEGPVSCVWPDWL